MIGLFYTAEVSLSGLGWAALVFAGLIGLNVAGVRRLSPYLLLGLALWILTYRSSVHATVAGMLLAMSIPIRRTPG